jgi:hypothetical protein
MQPCVQGVQVVVSGLDYPCVLEDYAEVAHRIARGKFVEHLVGKWTLRGDELTEYPHPFCTANDFEGLFRCVVDDQIVPEPLKLIVDLTVGAG